MLFHVNMTMTITALGLLWSVLVVLFPVYIQIIPSLFQSVGHENFPFQIIKHFQNNIAKRKRKPFLTVDARSSRDMVTN